LGRCPLGVARDLLGSYHPALLVLAALSLLLAIVTLFFGKPHKKTPQQQPTS
jgi:cyanate permease